MATEEIVIKPVIIREAIVSYPHFDTPQEAQNPGEKPKYGGTFVVLSEAQLAEAKEMALQAAIKALGPTKGPRMVTTGGKGSTFRNDVDGKYAEGSIYISARSETKPGMVFAWAGGDGKPALVPADQVREVFYPGAVVNVQVKPFYYNKKGNQGIGWALNNIQKLRDGERLDSRQAATEAFDADMSAVPADLKGMV